MRIPRLYLDTSLAAGLTLELPAAAAKHVQKVLRKKPGDPLILFDGNGGEYTASITQVNKRSVSVTVMEHNDVERESPLVLQLAQAISTGNRMDYTLQKAVELGINRLIPLFTERSRNIEQVRIDKRMSHWHGVIINACEQSGRTRIPTLDLPMDLNDWLQQARDGTSLVLDPCARQSISDTKLNPDPITLIAGPEGGFSKDEINLLQSQGIIGVSMGPRILRTETAAVVALSVIQSRMGGFNPVDSGIIHADTIG